MPEFWQAHYYAGVCKKAIGEFSVAEKNFRAAIKIKPTWQSYSQIGDIKQMRDSYDSALSSYEEALRLEPKAIPVIYELGNIAFTKGNSIKATRLYQKCNELDPTLPRPYVMQGLVKLLNDRKSKVVMTFFNKALEHDPNCREALFWRGMLALEGQETAKTLSDWGKLVELDPEAGFFRVMRGFLFIELGDYENAFNDFRKVVLSGNTDENAFRGGQTLLDRQIDIQYATNYAMRNAYGLEEEALKTFKKGFCLFLIQKYRDALREFHIVEQAQTTAVTYFMEGLSYEYLFRRDSAMIYYDKALNLDNDIFDAHKKRGMFRFDKQNWRGAFADFSEMIRIQPDLLISYRLRGLAKFEIKDYVGSMIDFSKYLKSDILDYEILGKRGVSFFNLKKYPEALKDLTKVVNHEKKDDTYFTYLSATQLQLKDTTAAFVTWDKFIEKNSQSITGYAERAELHRLRKAYGNALQDIERAISTLDQKYYNNQTLSDLLYYQGVIYFEMQNFSAAVESFSKSLKEDKTNERARYYRGKAFVRLGKVKDAQKDLRELAAKGYLDSKEILDKL